MICRKLLFTLAIILAGCGAKPDHIHTEFLTKVCIRPYVGYKYYVCHNISFCIEKQCYFVPKDFETDLASIPRIAWFILSPANSTIIRAAIVHDWFYRKSCLFNRKEADLIFYHMLKNDGASNIEANIMYYAVRWFGASSYSQVDCHG